MAGDVDLFLSEDEDDGVKVGEVNIMTAEERSRRKGLGKEAMLLMMNYGVTTQGSYSVVFLLYVVAGLASECADLGRL